MKRICVAGLWQSVKLVHNHLIFVLYSDDLRKEVKRLEKCLDVHTLETDPEFWASFKVVSSCALTSC